MIEYKLTKATGKEGEIKINFPKGGNIRSIKEQKGKVFINAEIDTKANDEKVTFMVIKSGDNIPEDFFYITTYFQDAITYHVYRQR